MSDDDIKIEPDPEVPGRYVITMPDPRPTAEELAELQRIERQAVREALAAMRSKRATRS